MSSPIQFPFSPALKKAFGYVSAFGDSDATRITDADLDNGFGCPGMRAGYTWSDQTEKIRSDAYADFKARLADQWKRRGAR